MFCSGLWVKGAILQYHGFMKNQNINRMGIITTINKWKFILGKNNPVYQQELKYYNLYHNLPLTIDSPRQFIRFIIFALLIILGAFTIFAYALINGLVEVPKEKNSDYIVGMTICIISVIILPVIGFFLIRAGIRKKKKWKSYKNAFEICEGTIIGKWTESAPTETSTSLYYCIALQYDGYRKVQTKVSIQEYYKLKLNAKVKLRFVRFQPEICELINYKD